MTVNYRASMHVHSLFSNRIPSLIFAIGFSCRTHCLLMAIFGLKAFPMISMIAKRLQLRRQPVGDKGEAQQNKSSIDS